MAEFETNLWAPWRMQYIDGLRAEPDQRCFLCHYRDHAENDAEQLVLWRTPRALVLLNRYPYTSGHSLVAPAAHVAEPEMLDDDVFCELARHLRCVKQAVQRALGAEGFNIGMNLGRCAGAGLPEHLHWHIVPRWSGDTNYMGVVGGARVIPDTLEAVRDKLLRAAAEIGVGT